MNNWSMAKDNPDIMGVEMGEVIIRQQDRL
jgi:hypothetical protein